MAARRVHCSPPEVSASQTPSPALRSALSKVELSVKVFAAWAGAAASTRLVPKSIASARPRSKILPPEAPSIPIFPICFAPSWRFKPPPHAYGLLRTDCRRDRGREHRRKDHIGRKILDRRGVGGRFAGSVLDLRTRAERWRHGSGETSRAGSTSAPGFGVGRGRAALNAPPPCGRPGSPDAGAP